MGSFMTIPFCAQAAYAARSLEARLLDVHCGFAARRRFLSCPCPLCRDTKPP